MALENVITYLVLDVIDHDQTQGVVKAIALDSKTRYVKATLVQHGLDYDVDPNAVVTLTILRPDNVGVQITGSVVDVDNADRTGTIKGVFAELTQAALAKSGTLKAQFKMTVGQQILRTEIFQVKNGIALDGETSEWADQYQGYDLEEVMQAVNNMESSLPQQLSSVADLIGYDLLSSDFQTGAYSSSGVTPSTGRAYCIFTGVSIGSKLYFDSSKYLVNYYYVASTEDLTNRYTPNAWDDTGEITLRYMDNGVVFVAVKRVGSSAYLADLIDDINRSVSVFNLEGTSPNYNGVVTGTTLASNNKLGFYSIGGYSTSVVSSMTDMPCDDFAGGYLLNTYVGSAGTVIKQTLVEIGSGVTVGRTFTRLTTGAWFGQGYINWVAFGDSITHGSYSDSQGQTLNDSKHSYAFRLAKNLRHDAVAKFYNCAVRGIGWVNTGNNGETFSDMMALFTGDKTTINLVTIMLGINDYISLETLGTTASAENDGTISGAIRYGLRYLCENYPNAKIVAISPLNSMNHGTASTGWSRNTRLTLPGSLQDVCDMIAYWCNIYNVTYINEISESFLNNYNMPTYLKDNLHPTDEGQWMLARELSRKIFV